MEKSLEDIWPIQCVEHDLIVNRNGDYTACFKIEPPAIGEQSSIELEAHHQAWIKGIKLLPKGTVVCKQDWFVEEAWTTTRIKTRINRIKGINTDYKNEEKQSLLTRASDLHFNERACVTHEGYLFVTRRAERRESSSLFSSLTRRSIVPECSIDEKKVMEFLDSVERFMRVLEGSGCMLLTRLRKKDIYSSLRSVGLLEKYARLAVDGCETTVKDISFRDGIQIGEKFCQLLTLGAPEDLPASCSNSVNYERYSSDQVKYPIGFASPLGSLLPFSHMYSQYLFIEDTAKVLKKLEAKRRRLQSLSAYSRENELARQATDDFLNEAIAEQRLPVKAHFNVLVFADSRELLKQRINEVSSAGALMEASLKLETVGAPQIWWAGIPGNAGDFPMNECFDSFAEQAACFFNMEGCGKDSKSVFGIRLCDRFSARPLHVDLSDEPMARGWITNRNKAVFGGSGSGKSMFMNHLVRSYLEQGAHAVIVDVGHSYEGLCELMKGYYFTYSETDPIRFNPFFLGEGELLDTEKRESIKTLLLALWKKDDEHFRRSEYVALSNALQLYFDWLRGHPEVFPCFNSFYEFVRTEFVAVLEKDGVKEKDFDISNFLYVLRPFYSGGEFDYLLNATKNLDLLQQPFIVFELDSIKDHPILFPAVTLIIMELFISKMRKLKGVRKMIVIEEAWKAIAKAGMAEFIKYLYKTVRKFFGEAVVVSQELDDVANSPIIKEAILNNCDCKILLDMRKFQNKFDQIQAMMGLPDKGKAMVLSLNRANDPSRRYRELFVDLGGVSMKVYGYEPSLVEYFAYTTEEREKMRVREYAKKYGGIQLGLAALAADIGDTPN